MHVVIGGNIVPPNDIRLRAIEKGKWSKGVDRGSPLRAQLPVGPPVGIQQQFMHVVIGANIVTPNDRRNAAKDKGDGPKGVDRGSSERAQIIVGPPSIGLI